MSVPYDRSKWSEDDYYEAWWENHFESLDEAREYYGALAAEDDE